MWTKETTEKNIQNPVSLFTITSKWRFMDSAEEGKGYVVFDMYKIEFSFGDRKQ